jgi:hypothetical protein
MGMAQLRNKAIFGQVLRASEVTGSKVSRQLAYESGIVVSPKYWPALPARKYFLLLISVRG